ncbi:hypothetical protein ACI2OX_18675 [Bacillus sp. N9]
MTILDRIIRQKELEVSELKVIYGLQEVKNEKVRPSLYDSFRSSDTMNVIAEVKRASLPKEILIAK